MVTILLEKLTLPQLVSNLPAIYGTRFFIIVGTRARHFFLRRSSMLFNLLISDHKKRFEVGGIYNALGVKKKLAHI